MTTRFAQGIKRNAWALVGVFVIFGVFIYIGATTKHTVPPLRSGQMAKANEARRQEPPPQEKPIATTIRGNAAYISLDLRLDLSESISQKAPVVLEALAKFESQHKDLKIEFCQVQTSTPHEYSTQIDGIWIYYHRRQ